MELGAGSAIQRSVQLPQVGRHTLELLANGPEGVTVVAVFPVAVGVAVDRRRPDSGTREAERDAEAVVLRLTELIARERKQRGLPPLQSSPTLAQVALGHSQDMHENHFVAHTSRSTGEANQRVARAGVRTTLLLENIGRGYNADEIHAGLMESPGHRGNILHPDVRELGVGVVAEAEGDRVAFLATQLFARLAQPVDWQNARQDLFRAVAAQRKAHGRPAVALDQALSRAAQQAAERAQGLPEASEQATLDEAMRGVRSLPRGASVLSAALVKAEELEQVASSAELLDPRIVALGVGVVPLPDGASHALQVVLLLALKP
ncbi:MAG TPA: CAP domain-containing protein [Polyangiales bacterium]